MAMTGTKNYPEMRMWDESFTDEHINNLKKLESITSNEDQGK